MLETYITPVLMYYLQKYVKNIQPQDLQLSFWGGDAVLKNLQLRCDILEDELSHLPFVVTAGKIQELTIHVPWTTLGSESVEITAVNIECSAAFKSGDQSRDEQTKGAHHDVPQTAETSGSDEQRQAVPQTQPPSSGYLQGLLSRIIHNVVFHVKNLSVRIVDGDICATLHIKGLEYHNTNEQWNREFIYSDYLQGNYTTQSQCDVSDTYITLDQLSGGGQVEVYEDPLTSGFALIVRMMSTYRGNMLKDKRIEFWCTCLDFSITPRQFCLLSRLVDRVLSLYYSSKRHRVEGGADTATHPAATSKMDDNSGGEAWIIAETDVREQEEEEEEIVNSASSMDEFEEDSSPKKEEEGKEGGGAQTTWGQWMMSFVVSEGEPSKKGTEVEEDSSATAITIPPTPEVAQEPSSFQLLVLVDELTFTFKATQQASSHTFFSAQKHRSLPVMRIVFKGSLFRMHTDPLTQFFGVYQGFVGSEAYLIGGCMCSKFQNEMQDGNRNGNGTQQLDSLNECLVFRVGEFGPGRPNVSSGSLFGPKWSIDDASQEPDSSLHLCAPEEFSAFWFAYDYYDVGEGREREECSEVLRVGKVKGVVCPEVTHCYNQLMESLASSLEANPWRSANYVVIGDPDARTRVGIHLSPSLLTLSANCHGSLSRVPQSEIAGVACGGHFVLSMEECSVEGTVAMYGGSDSDDHVQHTSLQVQVPSLTLSAAFEEGASCQPLLAASHLAANYLSQDRGAGTRRSYLQVESQAVNWFAEPGVLTSTAAVVQSWQHPCDWSSGHVNPKVGVSHDSREPPATTPPNVVEISFGQSSLELDTGEECHSRTFVVGDLVGRLKCMRGGESETLPLLFGPINSSTMITPDGLSGFALGRREEYLESEGLIELFTSEPLDEDKDTKFATVELKTSGVLLLVSEETLSLVSQLVSLVTELIKPVGEEKDDEEESKVLYPPPLAVSEHFTPPLVSAGTGWLTQQTPVMGMSTPWAAQTVASQVSNPFEEEDAEDGAHHHLSFSKVEEEQHPDTEKAGEEATPPLGWLSELQSTVLEVNTSPIIFVFTSELQPSLGTPPSGLLSAVGDSPQSPIQQLQSQLKVLCAQEGRSMEVGSTGGDGIPIPQAIVLSLPQLRLGSSIAEVASLSEPIPRDGAKESWPWQLQSSGLSVYTFNGDRRHHLVKPAMCEVTLAAVTQQVGPADSSIVGKDNAANSLAIHVNFQPLVVSVSRHQLEMVNTAVSAIQLAISSQHRLSSDLYIKQDQIPNASVPGFGLETSSHSVTAGAVGPAHLPSPALSVVSTATFPPGGSRSDEGSTMHSRPSGLHPSMLLWIQFTVPKVVLRVYSGEEQGEDTKLEVMGENLVVSWDQQEAVCEGHFSMTSLDAVFLQRSKPQDPNWRPAVLEGILFSSQSPVLGQSLSAAVAQKMSLFERHLPPPMSDPAPSSHRTSPLHFITVGYKMYGAETSHKPSCLSLSLRPFEVLMWWPAVDIFTDLANAFSVSGRHGNPRVAQDEESTAPTKWPSLQLHSDAFRLLLPNRDASNLITLQADSIVGTSNLDVVPTRYIVNESAYHKVKASVRERRRPRLPAYQVDLAALSLWGCVHSEEGGVSLFPIVAKATLRLLYSPSVTSLPMDQFPFAGPKFKSVLACGHSVEANLTSNLSVLVTPPGAELIGEISSVLGSVSSRHHPGPSDDATNTHRPGSETYQITLTGQTCSVVMATSPADNAKKNMATPLVLLTLQNPVAVHRSCSSHVVSSLSLLNVACSTANNLKPVHLPELFQSTGLTKAAFFPKVLLDTRQGLPLKGTSGVSPSFLTLNHTHHHAAPSQGTRPLAKQPTLSVDCGRPMKISLSQPILERVSAFLSQMQHRVKGMDEKEATVPEMNECEGTSAKPAEEYGVGVPIAEHPIGQEVSCDHKWGVSVSTSQLLFEYFGSHERSSVGIACGWEELKACPSQDGSLIAAFSSCWLKVRDGEAAPNKTSYLVLPGSLTVKFGCHPQQSQLDGHYMMVGISIPILQLRVSLHQLHVLRSVLSSLLPSTRKKEDEGEEKGRVEGDRKGEVKEEDVAKERRILVFQDDLRNGSLTVAEQPGEGGYSLPPPGFVWFFPGGGDDTMPSMTWHYHEPRRLTHIHTMPLPFDVSIATESGFVDLSLGCLLQYFDEQCKEFVTAHRFYLSESTSTRVHLDPSSLSFSFIWRVCIQEVEWGDMDRSATERLSELVKDGVSAVVSPAALAGCLRVDSVYMATSIPTSALQLEVGTLDVTLLNHCHAEGMRVGEFSLQTSSTSNHSVEEEVFQVVVKDTMGRFKSLQGGGFSTFLALSRVDGKFVDFQQKTWKHCFCASNSNFKFTMYHEPLFTSQFTSVPERPRTLGSSNDPSVINASLNVDTILVDVSTSLAHSVAIASKAWLSREIPQAAIFQHYIIFNNTLEDLYFGQAGTDEVIMMQVRGCHGYSWKCIHGNHKKLLRVSVGPKAGWRWTKPFGVDREGLQCVEVCAADGQMANLYVKLERSGGCQLMITFLGNWFFSSMLPVNLQFKVDAVVSSQTHFNSCGRDQAKEDNPAPEDLMGLFPAHSSLPSCLASDSCFSGVSFAGIEVEDEGVWSDSLPLATSKENWSKPHLLAKIPLSSDLDMVECWYSVRKMEPTSRQPSPAQVTLAPLFVVQSCLPFDVNLRLLPQPLSASGRAEAFEVPGRGECSVLLGVKVDVVYHVTVCFEEGTFVPLDGRPFSISTKLLNAAPLLEEIPTFCEPSSEGTEWVDKIPTLPQAPGATNLMTWNLDPELTYELAPVSSEGLSDEKCPLGGIVATLSRTSVGTLVVHLRPRYLLLNKLPFELKIIYPQKGEEEQLYVGKQNMVAMESDSCCAMQESEFSLAVSWSSQSCLSSGLLSATQPLLRERAKGQSSSSDSLSLSAVEQVFLTGPKGLMAIVSVCHHQVGPTTVVTVKPCYYIHNRSKYNIQVSPFRLSSKALLDFSYEDLHPLTVVQPNSSSALVYWQLFGSEHPLRAISLSASGDVFSWSLPLSLRFVRHSFALPVTEHVGATVPAVLTSHEHSDGTVYLVVSSDPVPRVLVQNLCRFPVEVVESGTRGIHAVPLNLHPGHQSVYEPPTMAKVYPMMLSGEEEESEISAELRERLRNLSLRLRDSSDKLPGHLNLSGPLTPSSRTSSVSSFSGGHSWSEEEWSTPVSLDCARDQTVQFTSGRRCFVTTHQRPHCIQVTILPTGQGEEALPMLPMNEQEADNDVTEPQKCTVLSDIKVISVSLQDDHAVSGKTQNVLALTSEGLAVRYNKDERGEGGRLEVTVKGLQVDNELQESSCEYAVVAVPYRNAEWQSTLFAPEEIPLISLTVDFHCSVTHCIRHLSLKTQPVLLQVEDAMLGKLRSLSGHFVPPSILPSSSSSSREVETHQDTPAEVLVEADRDQFPLMVKHLEIDPLDLHINARATVRMFLSCDDLPLKFAPYNQSNVFSNWHEVSQDAAAHYVAEALWKVGWAVGSLEILGSPVTLVRSIGRGLREFFSIPYEGITRSPAYFIWGLGQGSTSLIRNIASGTIRSVTSFTASISRNMEQLSMDQRHMQELQQYRSQYQNRQQRGGSLATGLLGGITTFGHSLVSAVRGVVDQPLQEVERRRASSSEDNEQQQQGRPGIGGTAKDIITGVGKGVVGVVTKPVGGAMELVAHSGQGLIYGLGLSPSVVHSAVRREQTAELGYPETEHSSLTNLLDPTADGCPAAIASASTAQTVGGVRQTSLLVLSGGFLVVYPKEASSPAPHQSFSLAEHHIELVHKAEGVLQEKEEGGDGQVEAAVKGGREELVLRVIAGKPVQSHDSVFVGVQRSDPLSSWRLSVPSFAPSPEGPQGTTWEESPNHHGSGSLNPSLQLATSAGKEALFIFCSKTTATHLMNLVHLTQLHFTHGPTFFFTA